MLFVPLPATFKLYCGQLVIVWVDIGGPRHPLAFIHHPIVGVLVLNLENNICFYFTAVYLYLCHRIIVHLIGGVHWVLICALLLSFCFAAAVFPLSDEHKGCKTNKKEDKNHQTNNESDHCVNPWK